jgi:hypothetical protein
MTVEHISELGQDVIDQAHADHLCELVGVVPEATPLGYTDEGRHEEVLKAEYGNGGYGQATCSCGWKSEPSIHPKILQKASEAHHRSVLWQTINGGELEW